MLKCPRCKRLTNPKEPTHKIKHTDETGQITSVEQVCGKCGRNSD